MENWRLFADPRFELQFMYPATTPQGWRVEMAEGKQGGVLRVHLTSPGSQELYFEVTEYAGLSAVGEYRQHTQALAKQYSELEVTELRATSLAGLPAYAYLLHWPDRERKVILVEKGEVTYRILYDPQSALNEQLLSSVKFLD